MLHTQYCLYAIKLLLDFCKYMYVHHTVILTLKLIIKINIIVTKVFTGLYVHTLPTIPFCNIDILPLIVNGG